LNKRPPWFSFIGHFIYPKKPFKNPEIHMEPAVVLCIIDNAPTIAALLKVEAAPEWSVKVLEEALV
jgi:hypothetical protein